MQRRKYGNKKLVIDGIKFDSKLEHYCYGYLKLIGADFDFQYKVILIHKFKFNGTGVRETTLTVDFVVRKGENTYYVDTKGFATEVSKLKYKMLKDKLKEEKNVDIIWLKNKSDVNDFINSLID